MDSAIMESIGALCGGVTANSPGHAPPLINLSLAEGYMLMTLMFELIHFFLSKLSLKIQNNGRVVRE